MNIRANLQLVYVSDVEKSTAFYKKILRVDPVFTSPRYVAFPVAGEALFAIWTGAAAPTPGTQHYSEIGIMLPTAVDVDAIHAEWRKDAEIDIVSEPHDEIFGRTFLVHDPDGHVIRVCPLD